MKIFAPLLAAILTLTSFTAPSFAQERVYFSIGGEPRLPACEEAISSATGHIASAYPGYYNDRVITATDQIAEAAYTTNSPSLVARRYCNARVTMNDGSHGRMYYMIIENAGFVGLGWDVEACIAGQDRWHVYDGHCRTVRPGE